MRREKFLSTEARRGLPFLVHCPHNDASPKDTHSAMTDHAQKIAQLFRAMADLLATRRANPYRIRAYRKAADSILAVTENLADLAAAHQLDSIPGIGRDLGAKIEEFLNTGTIRAYEELKTPLPDEVRGWATLPGLTDALVSYLYFRLNIRTLADLETLVASHLLRTQPGFIGSETALLAAIRQRQQPIETMARTDEAP